MAEEAVRLANRSPRSTERGNGGPFARPSLLGFRSKSNQTCHPGARHRDPQLRLASTLVERWIPGMKPGMTEFWLAG
jgi:hypothetical protein